MRHPLRATAALFATTLIACAGSSSGSGANGGGSSSSSSGGGSSSGGSSSSSGSSSGGSSSSGGGVPGAQVGPTGRGAAPAPTGTGTTLHVSKSGSDASTTCSATAPCLTIQRAADLATTGSVVLVENGDYVGFCAVRSGVTFFASGDTVRVTDELTGADCNQRNRVGINVEGTDDVVVAGFTVTGMQYAGIRAVIARGVVIRHNRLQSNGQSGRASGILTGFAPHVQVLYNETFENTEHGIYVSNSDTSDDRPVIRGNDSHGNGYNGIQINGDCFTESDDGTDGKVEDAIVDANWVHGNVAKGLSMISAPRVYISNNVIEDNGPAAGGVHLVNEPDCPAADSTVDAVVVNNTIVEPHMAAIRINEDATGAVIFDNILVSSNPVAIDSGSPAHYESSNVSAASTAGLFATGYQLAATSPARDAGVATFHGRSAPAADRLGVARPAGPAIDAGAYESF
jgi:hypothetical protein